MRSGFWHAAGQAARGVGLLLSGIGFLLIALSLGTAGAKGWMASPKPHTFAALPVVTQIELGVALLFVYFGVTSLVRR